MKAGGGPNNEKERRGRRENTERGKSRIGGEYRSCLLFFFRRVYICRLVFAHSRAKEANASVIRTMRAQKKGPRASGTSGRKRETEKVDKERARRNVVGATKMAEEEVDAAFLLICEISLLSFSHSRLFSSLLFLLSLSLSLSLSVSLARSRSTFSPFSRLVTLPVVPPVCKFAVHRNARVLVPSFSIDHRQATRPQPKPTDFLFHCFYLLSAVLATIIARSVLFSRSAATETLMYDLEDFFRNKFNRNSSILCVVGCRFARLRSTLNLDRDLGKQGVNRSEGRLEFVLSI